jgi:hypothetical protein
VTACCGIDVTVFGHWHCGRSAPRTGRTSMAWIEVNRPVIVQPLPVRQEALGPHMATRAGILRRLARSGR